MYSCPKAIISQVASFLLFLTDMSSLPDFSPLTHSNFVFSLFSQLMQLKLSQFCLFFIKDPFYCFLLSIFIISTLGFISFLLLTLILICSTSSSSLRCKVRLCIFFYLFIFNNFIYLFLAALGLHCCVQTFCSGGEWGLLFIAMCRLLIVVASLVAEHGLQACGLQQLWHTGLVAPRHVGIFPDQGSNQCSLH